MGTPKASVTYNNHGRVVIVTGASGGIGSSIAKSFADTGAQVVCADVRNSEEFSNGVVFQRCDVSVESDCDSLLQFAIDRFGRVDVLINNAAIQPVDSYKPIDELPTDVYEKMVRVNLSGYHMMAKYALAQMKQQKSGVVCNIASTQAHRTARQVGVYGPIKAANVMQARQWAIEYARDGIRVNSVSPGAIETPMISETLKAQGGREALANRHPLGRIGKTSEVANAVLWLCSDDASFITGTDLEVDGGLGAFGAFANPFELKE